MEERSVRESKAQVNIEYLVHKFNREFEPVYAAVVGDANEGEDNEEEEQFVNYRQLQDLLYEMGYASGSQSSEQEERILLSTMWSSLGGEETDKLNKEVIRAFLIAVEGVKITDGVKTEGPEEFGETKDGDFFPDCDKISRYFKLFYLNRIRFIGLREKPSEERARLESTEQLTFKPKLSQTTENYAQKYRDRIAAANEHQKVSVMEILTAKTNKDEWIEETKKDLEEEERKNCTFRPQINRNYNARQQTTHNDPNTTGDKCFDLYQLSVIKRKEKQDKTANDYEYEKNKEELTFQPNITKKKVKKNTRRQLDSKRSEEDAIERMRKARQERERVKQMTERGYVPGKASKPLKHGQEKSKKTTKAFDYSRKKPTTVRPPEESTLYQPIGHVKDRPDDSQTEQSMSRHHKSRVSTKQQNRRPAAQRKQPEPQVIAQMEYDDHVEQHLEQSPEEEEDQQPIMDAEEPVYDDDQQSPDQEQDEGEGNGEREPLLFVDVNLGPGRAERIVVYEGDTAELLAQDFADRHNLDDTLKGKLVILLQDQISGILQRIDEEGSNYSNEHV